METILKFCKGENYIYYHEIGYNPNPEVGSIFEYTEGLYNSLTSKQQKDFNRIGLKTGNYTVKSVNEDRGYTHIFLEV